MIVHRFAYTIVHLAQEWISKSNSERIFRGRRVFTATNHSPNKKTKSWKRWEIKARKVTEAGLDLTVRKSRMDSSDFDHDTVCACFTTTAMVPFCWWKSPCSGISETICVKGLIYKFSAILRGQCYTRT